MERLKGLLKRRSTEIRATANSFSEMEVVSDPENTAENLPNHISSMDIDKNVDDTIPLMMGKIETLTIEKYSLEDRLIDLTSQLERKTEVNLTLQSKCEDLVKSMELEKQRFRWQQKFYEKRIQQLTGLDTGSTTISRDDCDESSSPRQHETDTAEMMNPLRKCQSIEDLLECNTFYEETIKALVTVQDNQNAEMRNLKKEYEDRLKSLSLKHESDVSEILESHDHQVQKLITENEGLIRDLLTGCEGLFDDLKSEYTEESRSNVALKTKSGENIIVQFKALPPLVKGIVVAGITVISVATAGWASWGFIIWVWPRLLAFSEALSASPEAFAYLLAFLNSVPFQAFLRNWEEGRSLGDCLKAFANTEFLSSALRMAPDLFSQFKKFPRPIAN